MYTQEASTGESPVLTLRAQHLRVAYDTTLALTIKNLECRGKVIAVVGHNGAGKSTLLKSILGLLPLSAGTLTASVSRGAENSPSRVLTPEEDMAFCPETGAVFTDISVESYIKLWCRIKHGDPKYYRAAGSRYIDMLNVGPLLKKKGRELSKGQCRRVQTAIGFLTEPKLFLFDEPFDGLDVQRTTELADLILAQAGKTTFMISSHRMEVMERTADQLLVLKQGTVASVGPIDGACKQLAGETTIISKLRDAEKTKEIVRLELPYALTAKVGGQLFITERSLPRERLDQILNFAGESEADIQTSTPRLVDAMNYHLAEMQREKLQ